MNKVKIASIINEICEENNYNLVNENTTNFLELKFREDIGFDSFNLAQLTVMIEDEFDVDVFEDGVVETVGEIIIKIKK
jgi:acyl carrier protein